MISKMVIKRNAWTILRICIAISLVILVLVEIDVDTVTLLWKRISVSWLLLSALALYCSIWCMARRYWMLLGMRVNFRELFYVVLYQNVMGNLVATAAGTAWYVGNLRSKYNISVTHGLFSLFLARFGDLLTWFVTLTVATLVLWNLIGQLHSFVLILLPALATLISGLLIVVGLRRHFRRMLQNILSAFKLTEKPFIKNGVAILDDIARETNSESTKTVFGVSLYSALVGCTMIGFAYSSLQVFDVPIGIWPVVFVVALTQIAGLVPIQVFGGLGLYDFTYLYLYGVFGVDRSGFAAVVVGLRILFYLINAMFFLMLSVSGTRLQGGSSYAD